MSKGHWSFLHEWAIYDYLLARGEEKTLRLKKIIERGKLLGKSKWIKVESILPIIGTSFPDIKGIKLKDSNKYRPAEVKFTTSLFKYHLQIKHREIFSNFKDNNGIIIVASHDYLPVDGLLNTYPNIEVFEIEMEDFITFCRENFSRLLNRQIKVHNTTKVWLLYQGPNFNEHSKSTLPARESKIWCPTENLTGFDLAVGDRILFFKTKGLDRIKLQNKLLKENQIDIRWILKEIYVAEVISKIFSRPEYCNYAKIPIKSQLWKNDPKINGNWRWNRVFRFKKIRIIPTDITMKALYEEKQSRPFALKAWEAFCFSKSREITLRDYRDLLEILA